MIGLSLERKTLKNSSSQIVIASRESRLAMWQAIHVKERLEQLYPDLEVVIKGITTKGDKILDRTLSKVGGKGLFVKELEVALASGEADIAVHSFKDVPMELPDGFTIAAVLDRASPFDAFVSPTYASLNDLPKGAVLGTSSLRRQANIASQFPDLVIKPLRGNLDTRLAKLDSGEYDAIILAAAGLERLEMASRIRYVIPAEVSLPAPGQGALAIEIHQGRHDLKALLAPLHDTHTDITVRAERTLSRLFGGSCQVPLAAYATLDNQVLRLRAMIATPDGKEMISADETGDQNDPEALGKQVCEKLTAQGALAILQQCKIDITQ